MIFSSYCHDCLLNLLVFAHSLQSRYCASPLACVGFLLPYRQSCDYLALLVIQFSAAYYEYAGVVILSFLPVCVSKKVKLIE